MDGDTSTFESHRDPAARGRAKDLARFDGWAKALDARFSVFGIPVGWDSILGLIPGVGDAVTVLPAAAMMHVGYRAGIRKWALGRMAWNTGVDLALGSVPLIGDLFDVGFKSHRRNVAVLRGEFDRLEARADRPQNSV